MLTVNLQIRLVVIIVFQSFLWAKKVGFLCNEIIQNAGAIRNSGIIGGRAL